MALISKPWQPAQGLTPTPAQWSAIFDRIYNEFNGNIDDTNIDKTKIATLGTANTWTAEQTFTSGVVFPPGLSFSASVFKSDVVAAAEVKTLATLEWDPEDESNMTDDSSGVAIDFKMPNDGDDQEVYARLQVVVEEDADGMESAKFQLVTRRGGNLMIQELYPMWSGSQAQYDALASKDARTLYITVN